MAITTHCPNCHAKVRSPAELVGKRVQCPKCSTSFRVEDPNPGIEVIDDVEVVEDEPAPRPKRRPPVEAEIVEGRPRRRRPRDDEDDDDFEEARPARRRGSRRGRAEALVKGPAIAMMVIGGLGMLVALASFAQYLTAAEGVPPQFVGKVSPEVYRKSAFIGTIIQPIWALIVAYGGFKLLRLENWASVLVAVVFGMLPCNIGCCLGIPIGIWALIVMNNPEVSRAFTG